MVQEPVDLAPKIVGPERLGTFLQAVIAIPDLRVALLPAWKWERQTLESYVRGNGAALDGLRDLLGDFDWHPRHAAWHAEDLGEHVSWPHVRILLQARVAYLLSSGNEESALLPSTSAALVGDCMNCGPGPPTCSVRRRCTWPACK
jgi:hypothetical protein